MHKINSLINELIIILASLQYEMLMKNTRHTQDMYLLWLSRGIIISAIIAV